MKNKFYKSVSICYLVLIVGTAGCGYQGKSFETMPPVSNRVIDNPPQPHDNNSSVSTMSISDGPRGIYVVDDGDMDFYSALASPNVEGALVRVGWEKIETADEVYDFSILCKKITSIHSLGKKITLVNYAHVPKWLVDSLPSDQTWNSPLFGLQPVPWNENALKQMREFINAEASFVCGGYKIKDHPAILQVDTPILGMQSIRQAPSNYNINTLMNAVLNNIDAWIMAFGGESSHHFYTGLFPLGTRVDDAIVVREAILKAYPSFSFFQETLTGAGPSGNLAKPLDPNIDNRNFNVMLQACGYWSQTSRIKCSFAANDTPRLAYDNVVTAFQAKYLEIYPDDILFYPEDMEYIKKLIMK